MKRKALVIIAAAQLALFSSFAHADIIVSTLGAANMCAGITGPWNGEGNVSALSGLVKCKYHGTANIDGNHDFKMHVTLDKESGSSACPAHEDLDLLGNCNAGVITLKTDAADLSGKVSNSGTEAKVAGTVTFEVPILGKITAHIDNMDLHKG